MTMTRPVRKLVAFLGGTAFSTRRCPAQSNYHPPPDPPSLAAAATLPLRPVVGVDHHANYSGDRRRRCRSSTTAAATLSSSSSSSSSLSSSSSPRDDDDDGGGSGGGTSVGGGRRGGRRGGRGGRRGGGDAHGRHPGGGRRWRRTDGGGIGPTPPSPGQPGRECHRSCVPIDAFVYVVRKEDQRTGRVTGGVVSRHLTRTEYHPRGIKVMLSDGVVGRVIRFAE